MADRSLGDWLRSRVPRAPESLLSRLLRHEEGRAHPADLTARGLDALERALERPGRDRAAAFHLLAADALLTYACEAAAGGADVEALLGEILEITGDRFR